jgi:hypothetical protein
MHFIALEVPRPPLNAPTANLVAHQTPASNPAAHPIVKIPTTANLRCKAISIGTGFDDGYFPAMNRRT